MAQVLRDMVRNYSSDVERTPRGYLKGISLAAKVDAFTGQSTGGSGREQITAEPGGSIDPRQLLQEDVSPTDGLKATSEASVKVNGNQTR